jgi:uroporphyrinogen-III synthase
MFTLLATKKISAEAMTYATQNGIEIISKEFIMITHASEPATVNEVRKIADIAAAIVFTSKNAVKAVATMADISKSTWNVFCLEGATKKEVSKYIPAATIVGTAKSANDLASVIISSADETPIVFFCGSKRLDDLPQLMKTQGKKVKEIVVYNTELTPKKVNEKYDGVAFFSPSAVESFFSANSLRKNATCFSVGTTTSEAIKRFTSNKVLTSNMPTEQNLLDLVTTLKER